MYERKPRKEPLIASHRDLQHYEVTFTGGTREQPNQGTLALTPYRCEFEQFHDTDPTTPAYGIYSGAILEYGAWRCQTGDFVSPTGLAELQRFLIEPDRKQGVLWGQDGHLNIEFEREADGYVRCSGRFPDSPCRDAPANIQLHLCCFMSPEAAARSAEEIGAMLSFVRQLEEDKRVHRRPFTHHSRKQ